MARQVNWERSSFRMKGRKTLSTTDEKNQMKADVTAKWLEQAERKQREQKKQAKKGGGR